MVKNIDITHDDGTVQRFVPELVPSPVPTPDPPAPRPRPHVGVNLAQLEYYSSAMPFNDLGLMLSPWIGTTSKWNDTHVPVDSNGELTGLVGSARIQRVIDLGPGHPVGDYLLTWEGAESGVTVGGGRSDGPRRIVFRREASQSRVLISTSTHNVRKMRLVTMPESEQRSEWTSQYLKRLAPFGCIRFMDWSRINADRPGPTFGADGAPPTKLIQLARAVDLCNHLDADMWLCVHHRSDDTEVTRIAEYVRDHLRRKLNVEHSNEIWNTLFPQARYARTQPSWVNWHVERTAHIGDLFDAVGAQHTLWLGEQSAGHGRFFADLGRVGLTRLPANIDGVAIAPYFGHKVGSLANSTQLTSGGAEWILSQLPEAITWTMGNVKQWKTWCDANGLRLAAYEAGQHCVPSTSFHADTQILAAFDAAQRDQRMGALYADYLSQWDAITGRAPIMMYHDCASLSKWGSWGLCEHDLDTSSPKYSAVANHLRAL